MLFIKVLGRVIRIPPCGFAIVANETHCKEPGHVTFSVPDWIAEPAKRLNLQWTFWRERKTEEAGAGAIVKLSEGHSIYPRRNYVPQIWWLSPFLFPFSLPTFSLPFLFTDLVAVTFSLPLSVGKLGLM